LDTLPLSGITVVTLAVNLPGPAGARRLCGFGARVVKVEPPGGDPMAHYHPKWKQDLASGQEVVVLDLKDPEGRNTLEGLLAEADLLITATRPVALDRLGLGWEALHSSFPKLCQVAIIGFPAPRENEAGHDLTYQASLGLVSPPNLPRTLLADMAGAERTVSEALALLIARERGGEAGYAEVPLSEAAAAMAEPLQYGTTAPGALLGGGLPEYNIYPTRDGWVAVAALEPHFKKRLEEALGEGDIDRYREVFQSKTAEQWEKWGQERDIPIAVVKS
jgi:alpha-methylacyl-CoA racemase